MRFAAVILTLTAAFGLASQMRDEAADQPAPPTVFENRGKPMQLPFRCTAEDIRWAGLSCSEEEPCPVFLELSAAASWGDRTVVSGNIHGESVTLYSVLLGSDDGGKTWSEAHQRIRGAALDRIEHLDSGIVWISGEELFPLPRDPFLLYTEDDGKTWTERPVLRESAESRFGVVMQFFFSSKTTGDLILDRGEGSQSERYALFHSETGGQSWNIRQESRKPLRLPQTIPAGEWRVRVDAATRSYNVERRQGERWNLVAAFAVKLESCKPPVEQPDAEKP